MTTADMPGPNELPVVGDIVVLRCTADEPAPPGAVRITPEAVWVRVTQPGQYWRDPRLLSCSSPYVPSRWRRTAAPEEPAASHSGAAPAYRDIPIYRRATPVGPLGIGRARDRFRITKVHHHGQWPVPPCSTTPSGIRVYVQPSCRCPK